VGPAFAGPHDPARQLPAPGSGYPAGTIDVAIPKLRSGTYFPDWLLERRKPAESALITVVADCYLAGVSRSWAYADVGTSRHTHGRRGPCVVGQGARRARIEPAHAEILGRPDAHGSPLIRAEGAVRQPAAARRRRRVLVEVSREGLHQAAILAPGPAGSLSSSGSKGRRGSACVRPPCTHGPISTV
jgi:hypothetical protein